MLGFVFGVFSGVFTGFGVGGGVFLIMLLNWFTNFSQLEIQSINLVYYIPTAIFSIFIYWREKNIEFKIGIKVILLAVITAVIGAKIAHFLDINMLRKLFAIYLLIMGIYFFMQKNETSSNS